MPLGMSVNTCYTILHHIDKIGGPYIKHVHYNRDCHMCSIRDLTGKHVFDGSDASGVIGVPTDSMGRAIYRPLT